MYLYLGKSGEGRDMRLAKLCKGECGSKPAIWIDGGIHARYCKKIRFFSVKFNIFNQCIIA